MSKPDECDVCGRGFAPDDVDKWDGDRMVFSLSLCGGVDGPHSVGSAEHFSRDIVVHEGCLPSFKEHLSA